MEITFESDEINELLKALYFYASPDSYFAIAIWEDPPCGEFIQDFSFCDDWTDFPYNREMPGKKAREALVKFLEDKPEQIRSLYDSY